MSPVADTILTQVKAIEGDLATVSTGLTAIAALDPQIDVVNKSTVLSDAEYAKYVMAIQTQITRDFAPHWKIDARLTFTATPDPAHWQLYIVDNSDTPGALGLHELTTAGLPIGYVFAKTDLDNGASVSVTMSHEILEMLADPWINLAVQMNNTQFVAYETADACLTGDTKIPLLNGTTVEIKDLVGRDEFWLYSFATDGTPHPGRGHSARLTRKNAKIVEVRLDNDKSVKCTPDHLFMLRNGDYVPAGELAPGDSLMPLYRRKFMESKQRSANGYWMMMNNATRKWIYTHMVSAEVYGTIPSGWVRHHIDLNKENNDLRNIQPMSWDAHQQLHQRLFNDPAIKAKRDAGHLARRGKPSNASTEARHRSSAGLRKYNGSPKHLATLKAIWSDQESKKARLERTLFCEKARQKVAVINKARFQVLNATPEHRAMLAAIVRSPEHRAISSTIAVRNNHVRWHESRGVSRMECPLCSAPYDEDPVFPPLRDRLSAGGKLRAHQRWHMSRGVVSTRCELCASEGRVVEKEECPNNHKVIAVRDAGYADVYDLTVDKWNNFSVSAGVVVHNCESDSDGYLIGDVLVSNFVLPSYFELSGPGPFDFRNLLTGRMPTLRPQGYLSIWDATQNGWTQINGDLINTTKAKFLARPKNGSRRARRAIPRDQWLKSTI